MYFIVNIKYCMLVIYCDKNTSRGYISLVSENIGSTVTLYKTVAEHRNAVESQLHVENNQSLTTLVCSVEHSRGLIDWVKVLIPPHKIGHFGDVIVHKAARVLRSY